MNNNKGICLLTAFLTFLVSLPAVANPIGAQVVHGQVSFSTPSHHILEITNTPNAIINWQNFSISENEVTRFIQQSANSAVLNRVIGNDLSSIQGQLLSNGKVFLINPHGVVFGQNAIVDTAGFIASTLNITDGDFQAGNYNFVGDETSGAIENQGYIRAGRNGEILLIAPNITNSGIIETQGGQIILAAGESVRIASLNDPDIQFDIQAPDNEVINLGKLLASGGTVDVFAGTLRHSGEINVDSLSMDDMGSINLLASVDINIEAGSIVSASGDAGGDIRIESETGTTWAGGSIEANGVEREGGNIKVLGERVALLDNAAIDASGETGGGKVLIGGDYQGRNLEIKNAKQTYVAATATIRADAISSGDGGKVIVWADETTQVYGQISATGGAQSGDGGFIETSGKKYLELGDYTPDASAANGKGGTWLLDPEDINIAAVTANINQTGTGDPGPVIFIPAAIDTVSTINVATINTALNNGSNVVVDTTSGGSTTLGTITVSSAISKIADGGNADGSTLTLNADNDININADITSTAGQLNLIFDAARTTGTGVVNLGNVTLDANGGIIDASAETVNIASGATINSNFNIGNLNLTGGTTTGTGNITVSGLLDWQAGTMSGSGTTFANGGIDFSGAGTRAIDRNVEHIGTRNWSPTGTITGTGTLTHQAGTLTLSSRFFLDPSFINNDTVIVDQSGIPVATRLLGFSAVQNNAAMNINTGTLRINSVGSNTTGIFSIGAAGELLIQNTYNFNGGSITGAGLFTLNGSTFTVNGGTINTTGTTALNGGSILRINSAGSYVSSGVLNNDATVELNSGNLSLGGGGTHTGNFTVVAGSVLQFTGGTHAFNGASTSGAGSVAFTGGTTATYNGGTYAIGGDTGINGATTVDFNINANTGTLTHTAGILGGTTGSLTTTGWTPTSGVTVDINALNLGVAYVGTLAGFNLVGSGRLVNQGALTLGGTTTITPNFTNQGTLVVTGGGNILSNGAIQTAGTLTINTGAMLTSANLNMTGGTLQGGGTFAGNVNNISGNVGPGFSPGQLTITGSYTQGAGGSLNAEIGGATAGVGYDFLNVGGAVSLNGALNVSLFGGFLPASGDTFDIVLSGTTITGDFSSLNSPVGFIFTGSPVSPIYQLQFGGTTTQPPQPADVFNTPTGGPPMWVDDATTPGKSGNKERGKETRVLMCT